MQIEKIKYLTYADVLELIEKGEVKDKRGSLDYARELLEKIRDLILDKEKSKELINELKSLGMSEAKFPEHLIYQVVNIFPKNKDTLRVILKSSKIMFREEEVDKIFEIIKKYL